MSNSAATDTKILGVELKYHSKIILVQCYYTFSVICHLNSEFNLLKYSSIRDAYIDL